MSKNPRPAAESAASASNFIRSHIEADLAAGKYATRRWGGQPGPAAAHAGSPADPAKIRTRFPPEPNGYLHLGHAKSICLNFGLAQHYGGACHLRFDDTNPEKEEQEYVDSIRDAVQWLGFDWNGNGYFASDYFGFMYEAAEYLIGSGNAYVDEQSAEDMRASRGTLTEPGTPSPWRERPAAESLARFREMREGRHADGAMVLRAKIDMASPNMNLRDPAIYRIRRATHHRTGDAWCIYPMYTYAHPIEDALENITHSICTLEFEDQRPFYDWVLERIVPLLRRPQFEAARALLETISTKGVEAKKQFALHCRNMVEKSRDKLGASRYERRVEAMFASWSKNPDLARNDADEFLKLLREHTQHFTPLLQAALDERIPNPFMLPHQYEFNRLNLTYVVMSKRKLIQLVEEKHVDGWDDPRMPTLVGLRRRGFTPQAIQTFMERIGVSKSTQWIDYSVLEQTLRDDLDSSAPRATAVLEPIKLVIDNYPAGKTEDCLFAVHPHKPELGTRTIPFARELWIEREDFNETPPKGYFRLTPGGMVRLRSAYVIKCTGVEKDAAGNIVAVHADYLAETKSGTEGANSVKVKGAIHWLPVHAARPAEVRMYDRLFTDQQPDAGGKDFLALLTPNSKRVLQAYVEESIATAQQDDKFQFERNGYFVADRKDHTGAKPVFNLAVTLKDSWVSSK
jgi:glutaminyl-tRNA synthetase